MKYFFNIFLCFSLSACISGPSEEEKMPWDTDQNASPPDEISVAIDNLKYRAWYPSDGIEKLPDSLSLAEGFIVLADTNRKVYNYVSEEERYQRMFAENVDTTGFHWWIKEWYGLSLQQKLDTAEALRRSYLKNEDDIHRISNAGRLHKVYIINNTGDTVSLPVQDGSFICVLQARNEQGEWKNIQAWENSFCGNSYWDSEMAPRTMNSFTTRIPDWGNYTASLRYRIAGKNQVYFSNEFAGKIEKESFLYSNK